MATQKQIAANRRNAKKSTGPSTPEGKAICCLNGLRNGLHCRGGALPSEHWQALLKVRDRFMQVCQPRTVEQCRRVAQTACAEWKLLYWQQIHARLLQRAAEANDLGGQRRLIEKFSLRQVRLERRIREAYDALEKSIHAPAQPSNECLPAA